MQYHGQTVIFGSGLLSDETTETYKWLLETFVEAMGGKSPKAVITDGDLAMRDAIKNVLPDATHRLCGWHIQRNACENIKNLNFLRDFKGLIYDNNNHRDFDGRWAAILDKHNLVGSTWMEKTDLKEYRNNELIADFKSQCSEPMMITLLERAGALNIKVLSTTLDKVEFSVTALGDPTKDRRVEVDRNTNASVKDSGFSPERFANSSRSFSVKSEHHSGPKTKPFKKGGSRKFTATGMRNRKGNDNTFDERSLHESSESIDIASMNGLFNKNLYSLTQVNESQPDKGHSFTNYKCFNDVIDEKCDTPHVQNNVQDPLPSSMPCGNKQGSYMALFTSIHRTL
ncbi:hypothetical protein AHAS_Ahas02G0176000 [Arachis hypogaea]